MRLFLGGSNGLVLYEDGDLTRLATEGVLCLVRPALGKVVAGTETGSVLRWEGNDEAEAVSKDLGESVTALALGSPGQVLAGTMPTGLWTSRDGGETWKEQPALASAPGQEAWSGASGSPLVSAIAVHAKHPKTVYAGVEIGGVYRSRDGGKKWFNLGLPAADVHSIQISPARPERVYVTTGLVGSGGAFCTDDEGFSWRPMGTANPRDFTMGLAAHPTEIDRVIISAAGGPAQTWKGRDGAQCDVYLSTDAGRRFRTVVRGLKGGVRRKALVINQKVPSEVVFGTSSGDLWYSSDGGESFDRVAEGLGDLHAVAFA